MKINKKYRRELEESMRNQYKYLVPKETPKYEALKSIPKDTWEFYMGYERKEFLEDKKFLGSLASIVLPPIFMAAIMISFNSIKDKKTGADKIGKEYNKNTGVVRDIYLDQISLKRKQQEMEYQLFSDSLKQVKKYKLDSLKQDYQNKLNQLEEELKGEKNKND